jgi:hypothetical protein
VDPSAEAKATAADTVGQGLFPTPNDDADDPAMQNARATMHMRATSERDATMAIAEVNTRCVLYTGPHTTALAW